MRGEDLVIEVRQGDLTRVGQIMHDELDLTATVLFNNVGEWTLNLRDEHPLVPDLRKPGAGLVITGPNKDVLLSGPVVQPSFEATPEDRQGRVTFSGVTDDIILQDMLAWPQPANPDPTTQTVGADVREGPAETLMHQYVDANVGPSAPAARRNTKLTMGANTARGAVVKQSARFPSLGELLNAISAASIASGTAPNPIGFRVVQRGDGLVFETYETSERTDIVQLSVNNDGLAGQRTIISAPAITRAIVGGKGELEDRNVIEVSSADSLVAESEWGRRIEVFIDQRQEGGTNELEQAGGEALTEGGGTGLSVELIPSENASQTFGTDWRLGDRITASIDQGNVAQAYVNGYAFALSAQEGFIFGATLSETLAVYKATSIEARVSQLERNEGQGIVGEIKMWPLTTAPAGYLACDGSEKPIASYPALAAMLGTTFGSASAGNFRLPNFKGRSPVGLGSADSGSSGNVYNPGTKAGQERVTLTEPQLPLVSGDLVAHSSFSAFWQPSGAFATSQVRGDAFSAPPLGGTHASSVSVVRYKFGGNQSHDNLHPVLGINFIIKT